MTFCIFLCAIYECYIWISSKPKTNAFSTHLQVVQFTTIILQRAVFNSFI